MPAKTIAVLAAMHLELAPLVRAFSLRREGDGNQALYRAEVGDRTLVATLMCMGTQAAARATERILAAAAVDRVVCIGVAGGVGPSVRVRQLVVPEIVIDAATGKEYRPAPLPHHPARGKLRTSDVFETDPSSLAQWIRAGVVALDMETSAIAEVCERRGVAWSVARGLSDHVTDAPVDPQVLGLAHADGSGNPAAVARYLIARPWRVVGLARMARNSTAAARASVQALQRALPDL
jgi:adenosylhomocysteine nucleosidase